MRVGTVGFCADSSFLSRAVRWITRGDWSHTFIVAGHVGGVEVVIEADRGEVRLSRLDQYMTGYTTMFFEPVDGVMDIGAGICTAMSHLTVRYGFMQVIGIAVVLTLRRMTGLSIPNPFRSGDICSELDLRFLGAADPAGPWSGMDPDTTTPEDVFEYLRLSDRFMWPGMA